MNNGPFWMVWNPNGLAPAFQHASKEGAEQEATRLARQVPGSMFIVLEAIGGFAVEKPAPPPVRRFNASELTFDEIPF